MGTEDYIMQLEEQFPGWPDAYDRMVGYLFDGVSNDYPYIVACPVSPCSYLIPASIGYVDSLKLLSKAQRVKSEHLKHGLPSLIQSTNDEIGAKNRKSPVSVIVSKDPNDLIVKQMFDESIKDPHQFILMEKNGIVAYCLFSDVRSPTKCYVNGYSMVKVSPALLNGTEWIPNVVYEGRIQCRFTWDLDERSGKVTNLQSSYEFNKIVRFAQPNDNPRVYKELMNLAVRDARMYSSSHGHPACLNFLTKSPIIRFKAVNLWYFGESILLCPTRPRRLARVSPGLHVDCTSPMFVDIEPNIANRKLPLPPIREGQRIIANLWHNKLNNFYLVHSYVLAEKFKKSWERDDLFQLTNRLQLGTLASSDVPSTSSASETTNLFLVKVINAIFNNFYTCEQLGFALISDPKLILRNASQMEHLYGFPVWISVVPDEMRLARFEISALADSRVNYTRQERSAHYPDIHGHGILIVHSTGIVFSKDHPQIRIRLSPLHRQFVTIGQQFMFAATFFGYDEGFVVCELQLLDAEEDEEQFVMISSHKLGGDDILFVQKLKTHMRQWAAEGHDSPNFGPVEDPKELVSKYVRANDIRWPETIDALVCYNPKWMQGADTLMEVHSLIINGELDQSVKELIESSGNNETANSLDVEAQTQNPNGDENTASDDLDEDGECEDCLEQWGILRDILDNERAISVLEPELVQQMIQMRDAHAPVDFSKNQ